MLKKLLSKINIIDILIIISALIIIFSLAYRIISDRSESYSSKFVISAVCTSCPDSVCKIIETKPNCFLYDTQKPFGKIVSFSYPENPKKTNEIEINIEIYAKDSQHGIVINGSQLLIGKHINLIADNAVFTALIENIYQI